MRSLLAAVVLATVVMLAPGTARAIATGAPPPAFTIADTDGKPVSLAEHRGKVVVLEWTNPECPFVRSHYGSSSMQGLQKDWGAKGVVWLTINSTNQSHAEYKTPREMRDWMAAQGAMPAATLIDGTSATARAYDVRTTPQMFVIDPSGKLVYQGAIDDKRSANPADPKTAHNYVRAALAETLAGKPVSVANTAPYGCSLKY